MSNTSYSFKENSHEIVNQGGEKKVMKKILSVALSTAMAFSMFASVAFGADAKLTDEQQFNALKEAGILAGYPDGQSHLEKALTRAELAKIIVKSIGLEPVSGVASYKDKNYTANHWAAPFIEAATQAGILNGKDATKKLFDPTGNVTVQELAKVLTTALKLEVPADANNTASVWAKGYVAAAIKAGYLQEGMNYQANATRSQAVVAAYAIYEAAQIPTVTKYEVKDSKNVEFTLSTGEVVKVALEKELEANKATEVTFKTKDGVEIKHTVTYVVTAATKVESVSASNLKEVVITFDGEVEEASAEQKANYSIDGFNFESASLSEDGKSVTLLLDDPQTEYLKNQKEYKITVKNVRNSDKSKVISVTDYKFTPVDVTLPTVESVVGLGTSAFKVTFSEPVKQSTVATTANFRVDGKAIAGRVTYQYPNIAVVETTLATGAHTLTTSNVEDFNNFKITPADISFEVAEDTAAPEVVSAKTTDLTVVEIEMTETVKSVKEVYHTSTSKKADIKINDNKIIATFDATNEALSMGENTIYIKGVTDYSGNSADREVKVTPVLDVVRPEVASVTAKVDGNNHVFTVEYSESVNLKRDAIDKANYTLKDKDGKVVRGKGFDSNGHPVNAITPVADTNGRTYQITSTGKLGSGVYTLEINNIRDNAAVPNTMAPYSTSINLGDVEAPKVASAWYELEENAARESAIIYVQFDKAVAVEGNGSVLDANKYYFDVQAAGDARTYTTPLPVGAEVETVNAETVRIVLPSKANPGYGFDAGDVVNIRIANISDINGNFVPGGVLTAVAKNITDSTIAILDAKAIDKDTLEVKFDDILTSVDADDFEVTIAGADVNLTYKDLRYDSGDTIVTFDLVGTTTFTPAPTVVTTTTFNTKVTQANVKTTNAFGIKVVAGGLGESVDDGIAPELSTLNNEAPTVATATSGTYNVTLTFNENVRVANNTTGFSVYVDGSEVTVKTVSGSAKTAVINFEYAGSLNGKLLEVYLNGNNSVAKYVTDAAGNAADPDNVKFTVGSAAVTTP